MTTREQAIFICHVLASNADAHILVANVEATFGLPRRAGDLASDVWLEACKRRSSSWILFLAEDLLRSGWKPTR